MRCRSAERLLYLHREGELTPRQQSRLDRHLAGCPGCAETAGAIERSMGKVGEIRSAGIPVPEPEELTHRVMARITGMDPSGRVRTGRSYEPAWGGFTSQWLRPALASAAVLLLALLLAQELTALRRISRLEQRIADLPAAAEWRTSLDTPAGAQRALEWLETISVPIRTTMSDRSGDSDWIVLRRTELQSLLGSAGVSAADQEGVIRSLRQRFPDLRTISLEDGLSGAELATLLAHRTEIIHALRQL
jgi:hypothetical protein